MDSGRIFFDGSRRGNVLVLGNVDSVFRGPGSLARMEETSKRRPFFSCSPDELIIEEEYYDEQLPENKKRRLTSEQVFMLEKSFEAENKLEPERKTQLAKKLGLQPRQVAVWFQNRRARWKTKQLEKDYDSLKDTYDSLLSRYDAIVIENEKLKSQVVSLNEKLQAKEAVGSVELVGGRGLGPVVVSAHEVGVHGNYDHPEGIVSVLHGNVNKGEDHLSSTGSGGGGGSALVDDDGPQLMDSGHSYFDAEDDYHGCIGRVVVDGVQSEEDDGRDDFSEVFGATAAEQPQHAIGLWVWP